MAYSEPDLPVTGTSISSANFGIPVRNNQVDHQARLLVLEANAMQLIAEHEVASDAEYLVEFDSIPATYRHLKIVGQCRFVNGANTSANGAVYVRLNDDTASNYERSSLQILQHSTTPTTTLGLPAAIAYAYIGAGATDDAAAPYNASYASAIDALLSNYRGTAFYKTINAIYHTWWGAANGEGFFRSESTVWKSANAVTKISICSTFQFAEGYAAFKTGSYFSLYGMK